MSIIYMSCVITKSVFPVTNQVRRKPGYKAKEDDMTLEILDLGSKGIVLLCIYVAKPKELIYIFVLASTKGRLSHGAAKSF